LRSLRFIDRELAGIAVDWYIRLEQGRAVNPSATTLDALASALRLSRAEHAHLKALARNETARLYGTDRVRTAAINLPGTQAVVA
jgi:transcriptional regulator with XRE-family HTH domain